MSVHTELAQTWRRQIHGAFVITKKNALLYYLKPPVLIFGVLFPVFFFLTFKMGRPIPAEQIVPGMVAMALWFTASAVGPLVTPWERRAKTYERLIATPVSLPTILAGDVVSGLIFGACLSIAPVSLGLLLTDASITAAALLVAGIVLLSNLVRLPLLFVSGVFVPIAKMPSWAQWIAPVSPLSYAGDLIRRGFGQAGYFPIWLSLVMLPGFTVVLFWGASRFHRRWRAKGL